MTRPQGVCNVLPVLLGIAFDIDFSSIVERTQAFVSLPRSVLKGTPPSWSSSWLGHRTCAKLLLHFFAHDTRRAVMDSSLNISADDAGIAACADIVATQVEGISAWREDIRGTHAISDLEDAGKTSELVSTIDLTRARKAMLSRLTKDCW